MTARSIKSRMLSGLVLASAVLLAIGTIMLLIGGFAVIFYPHRLNPDSFLGRYSPTIGWVYLTVATAILVSTMHRWIKVLPGLFGYAVINGILMFSSGHLINNPSIPVSPLEALLLIVLFVAATALAMTFDAQALNTLDRAALLIFLYCFAWAALSSVKWQSYLAMCIALTGMLLAWFYRRLRKSSSPRPSTGTGDTNFE